MVSRFLFDIEIDGVLWGSDRVDVKQTVGSDYQTAPLEVGPPGSYHQAWNHDRFREAVEAIYRRCFRLSCGGPGIRMRDNRVTLTDVAEFDVSSSGGW